MSLSFIPLLLLLLPLALAIPTEHSFKVTSARPSPMRSNLQPRQCQPFSTSFTDPASVAPENTLYPNAPFIALSPKTTYEFTQQGLQLRLLPPTGSVHKFPENGTNDNLGQAGIMNSTFWIDFGRVTFEFRTSLVPGAVAALILIDANKAPSPDDQYHLDEIDIECVGKNQRSWQSNIFKPSKADPSPHYGVFSQTHRLTDSSTIAEFHKISIEKREEQIIWRVGEDIVRTLKKEDTYIGGVSHFPSDDVRLQFGIWDGSGAKGTSSWSGGPIDWSSLHDPLTLTVQSITVEC